MNKFNKLSANTIKQLKRVSAILVATTLTFGTALFAYQAAAAGDATFALTPASGSYAVGATITEGVSETSSGGDDTNAVQVNLSYPSNLTYVSTTLTGPFTICAQNTGGSGAVNIGCASSSAETGTQQIANITFTVATAGSASVAFTAGSDIDNTSGSSVFDGTLPSATFTLTAASGSGGSGGTGGTGSTTGKSAPKTPDTGSGLIGSDAAISIIGGLVAGSALIAIAYKYKQSVSKN